MRTLACVVFVVCLGFSGIATAMSAGGGGGAAGGGGGAAGGGGGGAGGGGGTGGGLDAGIGTAGVPWHEVTRPMGASSRWPVHHQRH